MHLRRNLKGARRYLCGNKVLYEVRGLSIRGNKEMPVRMDGRIGTIRGILINKDCGRAMFLESRSMSVDQRGEGPNNYEVK
jgi:hypothetical protein